VPQRLGRGIALLFHDRGTRRGWVVSSTPRPHFTPGKDPVPIVQEAGWAPGSVWTGGKSRPHRDSIQDRPARSQSLYRLSYRAHNAVHNTLQITTGNIVPSNNDVLIPFKITSTNTKQQNLKQYLCRLRQSVGLQRGWGCRISRLSAHECGKVVLITVELILFLFTYTETISATVNSVIWTTYYIEHART